MSVSQNFPNIAPSLSLDFANVKALDSRVTFTRASSARYYDGVTTTKAEQNLQISSQAYNNSNWLKVDVTSTDNSVAAPDGTTTASTIETTATSTPTFIRSGTNSTGAIAGQPVVISIFAKENTHSFLQILPEATILGSAFANFDLSTGSVGTSGGSGLTSSIVNVGGGWYRCIIVIASASGNGRVNFYLVDSDSSARASNYTGTVGNSLYLWGVQSEVRNTVTAYTPTTTQPITNYIPTLLTATDNVARFDHNPTTGESLGLLIEEQRTNLFTYSEQFDDAAWIKTNATVTANTVVAPDGTLTGDKLVANSGAAVSARIRQPIATSAIAYSFSVFAKAAEFTQLYLFNSTAPYSAFFNLADGTLGSTTGGASSKIENLGNGWYRCTLIGTATATTNEFRIYVASNGSFSVSGNGYSGIYIWGAQLE
jgi:hypothetical protein